VDGKGSESYPVDGFVLALPELCALSGSRLDDYFSTAVRFKLFQAEVRVNNT
jgi:hypothetical protein